MAELVTVPCPPLKDRGVFVTTHWSVVLAAAHSSSPQLDAALETLCRAYWYPIYVYVRRKGHGPDDAQDLTQSFFAALLEKRLLRIADPAKGKFRSFLLALLEHFLAREWTKEHRQKRGGGHALLSLDAESAESRYALEPVDTASPDKAFERQWALAVLQRTLDRLGGECATCGKGALFRELRSFISGDTGADSYAEVAGRLGMNEGAVKVAVHRMRRCFADLLRDEIGQTVADRNEIDEEIRFLFRALGQ